MVNRPLTFKCYNADFKLANFAGSLLLNHPMFKYSFEPEIAVVFFTSANEAFNYNQLDEKKIIIFDFHDWGRDDIWNYDSIKHDKRYVYYKLQMHDPKYYLNKLRDNFVALPCPLLMGGSRFHITGQHDGFGENLFSSNLNYVPKPDYQYDIAFINSANPMRLRIADKLDKLANKYKVFISCGNGCHKDAKEATIPYNDALFIHETSKINISTNGHGPWCLKDGECFSRGAFILREYHDIIKLHHLSPKPQIHWDYFTLETLEDKIKYYLDNDLARETIRYHGYRHFKDVLLNTYAHGYEVPKVIDYLCL